MPSGRTHDRITYWCLPFIVGGTAWVTRSPAFTLIIGLSFLVGGLMLGPDLDIHSVQYKRWGPIRWIWLPYQIALPHRSHFSHGPIIGTALRVVYLALWIALFTFAGAMVLNAVWDAKLTWPSIRAVLQYVLTHYFGQWLAILVGLEAGAMSHSISDAMGSSFVRKQSNRKKSARRQPGRKKAKRKKSSRRRS
ncbi:MAG: metal-binding protein [Cyanobacteria bacterium J06597_16]